MRRRHTHSAVNIVLTVRAVPNKPLVLSVLMGLGTKIIPKKINTPMPSR